MLENETFTNKTASVFPREGTKKGGKKCSGRIRAVRCIQMVSYAVWIIDKRITNNIYRYIILVLARVRRIIERSLSVAK